MQHFTPVSAFFGGLLIGLGAIVLMLFLGRIAGISGIVGGLLGFDRREIAWRLAFVLGLIAGPLSVGLAQGALPVVTVDALPLVVVVGGLLVGFGTRLGSGCTSAAMASAGWRGCRSARSLRRSCLWASPPLSSL